MKLRSLQKVVYKTTLQTRPVHSASLDSLARLSESKKANKLRTRINQVAYIMVNEM